MTCKSEVSFPVADHTPATLLRPPSVSPLDILGPFRQRGSDPTIQFGECQMTKLCTLVRALVLLMLTAVTAWGQTSSGPETVLIHSGSATLHAMLWCPQGVGPFPGILLIHGSGRTREDLKRLGPKEKTCPKTRAALCPSWPRLPILLPPCTRP